MPGALLGLVQLLKAEATAGVSVMGERSLGLADMPSEVLALPTRAAGSGRPPPSTSCSRQERSLEHGAVVPCLLLCFLLRVGAGVGAFPNFRDRTEGLQGGPGQEEIISFHTSDLAIGVEKLNVWKTWKNHRLPCSTQHLFLYTASNSTCLYFGTPSLPSFS